MYWVTSPRVVETAKKYFNCEDITGVPLQNYGYENSLIPSNHWSNRWMHTDLMTEDKDSKKVLSEITLALFEDSGWYRVRYFTGGLFRFGKKAGCIFFEQKCLVDGFPTFYNEFCVFDGSGMCDPNRLSRGICKIFEYKNESGLSKVPLQYRYFNSTLLGGNPLVDYCPVSMPIKGIDTYYAGNCDIGDSLYPIGMLDNVTPKSICFMSSLLSIGNKRNVAFINQKNPICYQVECDFLNNRYKVYLDGANFIFIKAEGGSYPVPGFSGTLEAPSMSLICTNKEQCNEMFECIKQRSVSLYGSELTDVPTESIVQKLSNIFTTNDQFTSKIEKSVELNEEKLFPPLENIFTNQLKIAIFVNPKENETNSTVEFYSMSLFVFAYLFELLVF